ncbi:sigma-70 family RNA polymerase sigma factor [Sporosarcina cascadiensis]|uniref:sigma-70 family RNA polymerase sigma factor n=1 Tax=Sporosarcina cascadiensis TaxID=2660747 RepID=UPI001E62C2BA|nr:sigma-70 family RNA polymerase sigma factor [Sporosarcina cascadiensis]
MLKKQERDQMLHEAMDEHGDYLLRVVFAVVKDAQRAEDIVQEVFIRYYLHLNIFEGRSSVKTYLYRIAMNECKNVFKSWSYRKVEISNLFQNLLVLKETPEEKVLFAESSSHVAQMVEALPVKYREVIWLYYYAELSVNEIGEVLDCPVNTVKTRLARGRKLARIVWEERSDDE